MPFMLWIAWHAMLIVPEHKALDAIGYSCASLAMRMPIALWAQGPEVARLQCQVRGVRPALYVVDPCLLRDQRYMAHRASVPIPCDHLPAQ